MRRQGEPYRHTNIGLRMMAGAIARVMAAAKGRDLSPEQNDALRPIVRRLIAQVGGQVKLEDQLGWSQSAISGFLSGRQGTSFPIALQVCAMMGENPFDVLGLKQPATVVPGGVVAFEWDPPAGSLLLMLGDVPGLKDWIYEHPQDVTISELTRAIRVIERGEGGGYARASDGRPHGGWGHFFSDLRAGKFASVLANIPHHGSAEEVRRAERAEIGDAPRKITIPKKKPTRRRSRHP
jgi:hypothetical protein